MCILYDNRPYVKYSILSRPNVSTQCSVVALLMSTYMLVHICDTFESAHVSGYFSVSLFHKIVRLEDERVDIEVNGWRRGRQSWLRG